MQKELQISKKQQLKILKDVLYISSKEHEKINSTKEKENLKNIEQELI